MRPGAVRDGFRLSFGTLTLVPVPSPVVVDRPAAGVAMSVAVLPGAVLGLVAGTVLAASVLLGVPPLVAAVAAVGTATLLTRFLHADGLADTADGLAASWDRQRALEVMHRGDVGPSGATVLVLVLLGQVAALAALAGAAPLDDPRSVTAVVGTVVLAWATSRAVLVVLTAHGTTPARDSGLGAGVLGTVPLPVAVGLPVVLALVALVTVGPSGALAVGVGVLAAGTLAAHAERRLGGLTGDVLGAGVEVALLASLAVLSAG